MAVFTSIKRLLQIFTIALRYLWLFFPAVLFLYAGYACFWSLSQGKDLLIASLETPGRASVMWVAVVFWVLTTWYSSRILVYKRESLYHCGPEFFPNDEGTRKIPPVPPTGFLNKRLFYAPSWLGLHLPRLLGYLCFPVIWLAYWQLPVFGHPLSSGIAIALLFVNILLYIFLGKGLERIWAKQPNELLSPERKKRLEISFRIALGFFLFLLLVQYFIAKRFPNDPARATDAAYRHQAVWVMGLLFIIQQLYLYVVVNRKHFKNEPVEEKTDNKWQQAFRAMLHFVRVDDKGERSFFLVFNIISLIAIVLYLTGVFNIGFAVLIGSAGFALLAFGILVGYFALVSIFSIHFRINFHIIILLLVFLLGKFREPHYARLLTKDTTDTTAQRPDLRTYFLNWALSHRDSIVAKKDSSYPVFFVLADGGASRSGYWVASVLGKLHDETDGEFSAHLFCLSGASGGSVGNATYFNLLKNFRNAPNKRFKTEGQAFLGHDFLSYTLARMLGPDFFRPILPIDLKNLDDRAGALEQVMEDGVDTVSLAGKFKTPFAAFIPDTVNRLPILCINTTRMQDGRPGVISNIRLEESIFGKRIDVIGLLKNCNDLRLSTAMVMGARFPYVSPAGRIDERRTKKNDASADSIATHYFVDGGYFDNSGAGVVHEMLIGLREITNQLTKTDTAFSFLRKLQYYVIHITNSPVGGVEAISAVHPIANDLFAPVTTLVGSYGTQTDVNDSRLEKYQQLTYDTSNVPHYRDANLYYGLDTNKISFPMSWAISGYYRTKMNNQVDHSPQIIGLVRDINRLMQNR